MLELVAAATMAPSKHNSQPWRFRFDPASQTIGLYADPERMLRVSTGWPRAPYCLRRRTVQPAPGRRGGRRHPVVRLTPDAGQPLLIAAIRLAGPCQPQQQEIELPAAIAERRTNRSPFSPRPVPPGVRAELAEAAQIEGAVLHFPDREEAAGCSGWPRTPSGTC